MKDLLEKIWKKLPSYSREEIQAGIPQLVKILTTAGRSIGVSGILRHYKWREVAMAEILGHTAHSKTSTGTGGDAVNKHGKLAEYKTGKKNVKDFEVQLRRRRLRFSMVYNGAYDEKKIRPYANMDHYFGLFDEDTEECLLIYHAESQHIIDILMDNNHKRAPGATTNLNTVTFDIDISDPRIVYWSSHAKAIRDRSDPSGVS